MGQRGLVVLLPLAKLLGTLYGALAIFLLLVLLPAAMLFRVRAARVHQGGGQPATIGFATSTSEAACRARWRRWSCSEYRGGLCHL